MSELPSDIQPTINAEDTQETSLSNMAPKQSISITKDNDLSHESASDGETGIASTSTENVSHIIFNVQPLNPFPSLTGYACSLVTNHGI